MKVVIQCADACRGTASLVETAQIVEAQCFLGSVSLSNPFPGKNPASQGAQADVYANGVNVTILAETDTITPANQLADVLWNTKMLLP